MEEGRKKRNVAVEKSISELTTDDTRVKVIGTVIEKDDSNNSIVVDDGSVSIRVLLNQELFEKVSVGKIVRVIGLVVPPLQGESVELQGEIVQDFSKLDSELYEKYLKLKNL